MAAQSTGMPVKRQAPLHRFPVLVQGVQPSVRPATQPEAISGNHFAQEAGFLQKF
jgi:hypothetical protein